MGRLAELRHLRERMERERASWRESRLLGFHEDSQRRAWDEYRRVVRLAPWWLRGADKSSCVRHTICDRMAHVH